MLKGQQNEKRSVGQASADTQGLAGPEGPNITSKLSLQVKTSCGFNWNML